MICRIKEICRNFPNNLHFETLSESIFIVLKKEEVISSHYSAGLQNHPTSLPSHPVMDLFVCLFVVNIIVHTGPLVTCEQTHVTVLI